MIALWNRLLEWLGLRKRRGIRLDLARVLADILEDETGYRFSPEKMAPHVVERAGGLAVDSPEIEGDGLRVPGVRIEDLEARLAKQGFRVQPPPKDEATRLLDYAREAIVDEPQDKT